MGTRQKGSVQSFLRSASTASGDLPEAVWPHLNDLALLRFMVREPMFSSISGQERELLEKMFSLDLPNLGSSPDDLNDDLRE